MKRRTGLCVFMISTTAVLLLFSAGVHAGAQWVRTLGSAATGDEELSAAIQTSDGGFVVAGAILNGDNDGWIAKLNASGDVQWQKTYGNTGYDDVICDIVQTLDGGYVATGRVTAAVDSQDRVWCMKVDANGNQVWNRRYGGDAWGTGNCIHLLSDGGFLVAGYSRLVGASDYDIAYMKIDANGQPLGAIVYGGTKNETVHGADVLPDGSFVMAGSTTSLGGGTYSEAYVLKTDTSGNPSWLKTYGGAKSDSFRCIRQTSDGGFIVAGQSGSYSSSTNAWCVKLTSTGSVSWQGVCSATWTATGAVETSDGNYLLTGTIQSGKMYAWAAKIAPGGSILWQKMIDVGGGATSNEQFGQAIPLGATGCLLAGTTYMSSFDSDGLVVRVGPAGTVDSGCGYILDGVASSASTTASPVNGSLSLKTPAAGLASLTFGAPVIIPNNPFCISPITISPAALPGAQLTVYYNLSLVPGGGVAPYTFLVVAGALPAGMSLSGDGHLQGTPTVGGAHAVSIQCTDSQGYSSTMNYTLLVATSACPSITLTPTTLTQAVLGTNYSEPLSTTGGVGPYTYSLTSGTLPADITMSTAGALTGIPGVTGTFPIEITATDSTGCTGKQTYSLVVGTSCAGCPTITSISGRTAKPCTTATIKGTGFSTDKKKVTVYFGTKKVRSITRCTMTQIKAPIPRVKGTVDVYVVVNGLVSNRMPFTVK